VYDTQYFVKGYFWGTCAEGSGVSIESVPAAFVLPGTQQMLLYGLKVGNEHILQLASPNNGKWTVTDLTQASSAPPAAGLNLVAYVTTPNNQVHVYFSSIIGTSYQGYQIYQPTPTTWAAENLTSLGNGSPSASGPNTPFSAGFSIQNYQYVFYIVD
jgi:hypothetical protein